MWQYTVMAVKVTSVMVIIASLMMVSTILLLALSLIMVQHSIFRYISFIIPVVKKRKIEKIRWDSSFLCLRDYIVSFLLKQLPSLWAICHVASQKVIGFFLKLFFVLNECEIVILVLYGIFHPAKSLTFSSSTLHLHTSYYYVSQSYLLV